MTVKISTKKAIERILAINWEPDDTRVGSHIALLQEYLRRAALWAKVLNCTEQWPFFDIAAIAVGVDPSQRADNAQIEALRDYFSATPFYVVGIIEKTCEWFLHWQVVKNQEKVRKFNLPDPYEPLILLYERGGIFSTEHGFFNFTAASFPRGTWTQHDRDLPVVELESAALDRLDGYSGDRVLVN